MFTIHPKSKLIYLSFILFLTACKKDSSNNSPATGTDYYIKFTLDGTDMLFANVAEGNMNVIDGSGKYTFTGGALKAINSAGSNISSLVVSSTTQIKTNTTYVNYATNSMGYERPVFATVSYIDAAGIAFNSWGDEFKSSGVISDTKITFLEITSTNLKGIFSGTTYKSINGAAEKHVMTKGDFNLKRR